VGTETPPPKLRGMMAIVPNERASAFLGAPPRERPRPAGSNDKPRPLRAVAGASIAPPPNLREIIPIVPSERLIASDALQSLG
jgi:hypothetical protein